MTVKRLLMTAMFVTISATSMYAQEVQMVTLQQGEDLQVFYGADGFKNALDAADHGDLITLSTGSFSGNVNITKSVTIQGAGYVTDIDKKIYPTIIDGNITLIIPEDKKGLLIEGINIRQYLLFVSKVTEATVKKCKISYCNLYNSNKGKTINCLFEQCRIHSFTPDGESENLYVKNSVISTIGENLTTATFFVENCVITDAVGCVAYFQNNIIGGVHYNGSSSRTRDLKSSCTAYNNVFLRGYIDNVIIKANNVNANSIDLFGKNILGSSNDNESYELTPEAQAAFLGTDGTQVGVYGGESPFTSIPSNPQIIESSIDAKSTPDGKLNVNIKVKAQ